MAEPIEMLFGLWTHRDPRNYALGGGPGSPMARGTLGSYFCMPRFALG